MLALIYNALCFQNIRSPEAMDAGQLARNIADGKGFVTSWVRPTSLGLLWERHGTNTAFFERDPPRHLQRSRLPIGFGRIAESDAGAWRSYRN